MGHHGALRKGAEGAELKGAEENWREQKQDRKGGIFLSAGIFLLNFEYSGHGGEKAKGEAVSR